MSTIAAASKNRLRVSEVVEVTRGTIPNTPTLLEIPHLDNAQANQNEKFERTAEIKQNRMGGKQVGGTIDAVAMLPVPLKNDPSIRSLFESAFSCTLTNVTVNGAGGFGLAYADTGAVRASRTITVTTAVPTAGDTLTVNGYVFTFRAAALLQSEITIGGTLTACATNIKNAINAVDSTVTQIYGLIDATSSGAVVTVKAVHTGTAGNAYTLATSNATNIVISGSPLTGGAAGTATITRTSGSFITEGWHIGDQITTTGSTTPANDTSNLDRVTVTTVSTFVLTLSDSADFTAEAFAAGTTLTSRSYYGVAGTTRKFFSLEFAYLDLSPIVYEYFYGMEVNTASIKVPTSGEVTTDFNMIGVNAAITNTIVAGGSYTAQSGTVAMAGSVSTSKLLRGGVSSAEVESLTVDVNNNRASKFAVGNQFPVLVEEGNFDIEMKMSLYFADKTVIAQYLAGTRTSLEINVADQQDGHIFALELPNAVFTTGDKANSGQTVVQNITAFGEESTTYSSKARIWFIPAVSST